MEMQPVRRIVVALDLAAAEDLIAAALALGKEHGALIDFVHVFEPKSLGLFEGPSPEEIAQARRRIGRRLSEAAERARSLGCPSTVTTLEGSITEEVARHARDCWADVILVGTRDRNLVPPQGSVAASIADHATCRVRFVSVRRSAPEMAAVP
jgi:nucleotide-binding universal stress UspA family protein